jgi:hypothetical protein
MSHLSWADIAMIAPGGSPYGTVIPDLIAWQKAMDFVMDVYRTSKAFPQDELYGLASQLRSAAVGVPTNIAEGQARFSANEFHYSGHEPEDRWSRWKPS